MTRRTAAVLALLAPQQIIIGQQDQRQEIPLVVLAEKEFAEAFNDWAHRKQAELDDPVGHNLLNAKTAKSFELVEKRFDHLRKAVKAEIG